MICAIALGAGLAVGAFLFQGLMALLMKLLEMEFSIAAYSAEGLLHTVLLTAGIFLLASAASAGYLKRVSIYDLIHGEKKVEKKVGGDVVCLCGVSDARHGDPRPEDTLCPGRR